MHLVEKELSKQNIEKANLSPEFSNSREREQKFVITNPETCTFLFKNLAAPIEQIYLSSPDDEFSLRVRCSYQPGGNEYTATLKDRGEIINGARDRLEVTTEISKQAYELYAANPKLPRIQKLRAEIQDGVTIDFVNGYDLPIIEVEHNEASVRNKCTEGLYVAFGTQLIEQTGNTELDNEILAHKLSGHEQDGTPESLDDFSERVLREMVAHYASGKKQVVAGLTGMSGSGKTTVTKAIQKRIADLYSESYRPIIISTDDYHIGKSKLEQSYGAPYSEWDDPKTYNTAELAFDLQQLAKGIPLLKRHFDFETEEPTFDEALPVSPFVIIEGLYASSKDLESVRDLHFELPTGVATSIGRDVRRLIIENRKNRAFPDAASRLRYQIETANPLYMSQEKPTRKGFSASSRILAERAFMLATLAETSPTR